MSEEFKYLLKTKFNQYFNEEAAPELIEACAAHYNLLIEYNEKFNLTRITDALSSVLLHYIDSFFVIKSCAGRILKDGVNICDIGSGGGFPSLPLFFFINYHAGVKNAKMTLIESSNKKAGFLDTVICSLDLSKSIRTAPLRIEEAGAAPKYREKFDIVTARALAALPTLLEYASPLVKTGGVCLLMKGEDIEAEKNSSKTALTELKLKLTGDFVYEIETMQYKRRVLSAEKTGVLSKKYPRQPGMAKKTPII
jgi:16S rRNA (guanine527-N7)-methyltransferase